MIRIESITPRNVPLFKQVRLRALQDSPSAFGATYAEESQLSDGDWMNRARRWNGERRVGFLVLDGRTPCGIAGSFLSEVDPPRAQLISMWTAPAYRRRGVGRLLVHAVLDWARLREARTLLLMVTSINEPAILFYQRLGFASTGRTAPYPNDPTIIEYEMFLAIP